MSRAVDLIAAELARIEKDIDRTQKQLMALIKVEKGAHADVEQWKDELNILVKQRVELEASRKLLEDAEAPTVKDAEVMV